MRLLSAVWRAFQPGFAVLWNTCVDCAGLERVEFVIEDKSRLQQQRQQPRRATCLLPDVAAHPRGKGQSSMVNVQKHLHEDQFLAYMQPSIVLKQSWEL